MLGLKQLSQPPLEAAGEAGDSLALIAHSSATAGRIFVSRFTGGHGEHRAARDEPHDGAARPFRQPRRSSTDLLYGPLDVRARGGIVAFNLRRGNRWLPYEAVEAAARRRGIAVRGGCFCNPGAAEHAFATPARRARACLSGAFSVPRLGACLADLPVGALRVSLGVPTTMADLDRLLDFADDLTTARPARQGPASSFQRVTRVRAGTVTGAQRP